MKYLRKVLFFLTIFFFPLASQGQIQFGEKFETLKDFSSQPIFIEKSDNYFLAYQHNVVYASRQVNLNLFFAKQDFTGESVLEVPLRWSHIVRLPKAFGDKFYFLCESRDKGEYKFYILVIDPISKQTEEIDLDNVMSGRIVDFEVMGDNILFLINTQRRIVAQILETSSDKIFTVDDIYMRGITLQKVFHNEISEEFNLLFSFRARDKSKPYIWSIISKEGIILDNFVLEQDQQNLENIEIMLENQSTLPFIAGTIGQTSKMRYKGYYAGYLSLDSNPFNKILKISDFEQFFSYEKDGGEKSRKKWDKSKNPSLKDFLSLRSLVQNESGFLLHSDHFLTLGKSFYHNDGMYYHKFYHLNPSKGRVTFRGQTLNDNFSVGYARPDWLWLEEGVLDELGQPIPSFNPGVSFSFISSHFLQLDFDGNVLWDYAIPLPKRSTNIPLSYGQILTGKKDHFLYTFDDKLFYSLISMGEIELLNMEILLPDPQKPGKILKSEYYDLELKSLNNGSFLLTGRQRLRFVDENDVAQDQDILFFQELNVNEF